MVALSKRNAGCIFKNPQYLPGTTGLSAGALIDRAGLKGFRIGNAEVSTKHANFIVAHPGCAAADILRLIEHVRDTVLRVHKVLLELEVMVWK